VRLWQRGGFPLSYLAADDAASHQWRTDFIRTFLERDIRRFGVNTQPEPLRRLWQMLAHLHGGISNGSEIGRSLGESNQTVRRHLDILTNAFMIRQLPPWFENLGKRLVRHPKVYVRDTGLLHALLGLATPAAIEGHPKCGASWEGFCIEQILRRSDDRQAWFWATHSGAELDLLLLRNGRKIGFEFKYSDAPRTTKSMHSAVESLELERLIVVHPGEACYPLTEKIQIASLSETLRELGTQ
jgi:predicted AAA+ superfamily ATPase